MPRPAAIFDLDGTLLPRTSAERLFLALALRRGTLRPARVAWGFLLALAAWSRGRVEIPAQCKLYLAGAACERLETIAVDCVRDAVVPRLRAELVSRLEAHRSRGDAIVLLSGTPDFLLQELARFLQADLWIGSRLERAGERFSGRVVEPYPYGQGKRELLLELARLHDLALEGSYAYADRASDAPHLELVGHPYAVAPDAGLRRAARRHGWPILEERQNAGAAAPARPGG